MRIALIGYGKMGKIIERVALDRGHEIVAKVDLQGDPIEKIKGADVAIEFTQPEAAPLNIRKCIDLGVPVVVGTTGWYGQKAALQHHCEQNNGTLFYASNFSLGVNVFFKINEKLAQMMAPQENYHVHIEETHHTQKKDSPSGTAITLAEGILKFFKRKKAWVNSETSDPDQLVIKSFRVDPAPGAHAIKYTSAIDDIEIKHTAHSREGFALGAVLVAEWIKDRKGVLTMADFLPF